MNKAQERFHTNLINLINQGGSSKSELLKLLMYPNFKNVSQADLLIKQSKNLDLDIPNTKELQIQVMSYTGSNSVVLKVQRLLNKSELKQYLIGAYIHGSLATNEDIEYSDFDALVILSEKAFKDRNLLSNVCKSLNRISREFYRYDPLQHHGWFVLTENMLKQYPSTYFPIELFHQSKSLLSNKGERFMVGLSKNDADQYQTPFIKLSTSLRMLLKKDLSSQNSYWLKSTFSQFMLLPTFFLQAMLLKGVDKKSSFNKARTYFENEDWAIMDEVSKIRENWTVEFSFLQRYLLTHSHYLVRKIGRRYSPKLNPKIKSDVSSLSKTRMLRLIEQMQEKIKQS